MHRLRGLLPRNFHGFSFSQVFSLLSLVFNKPNNFLWDLDFGVKKKGLITFFIFIFIFYLFSYLFPLETFKTLRIFKVCENFCEMRIAYHQHVSP